MAIYTRFGSEVRLLEVRLIPVWIDKRRAEITWYFKPRKNVECFPQWHYRAEYVEDGRKVCDGKWVSINGLVADDGFREIDAKLLELNPEDAAKFDQWNAIGGPEAFDLFQLVDAKEIA